MSTILIHDYETTGVGVKKDRPVQIGVCDGNGRIMMNTLCNPCMEIAEGAARVHGITAQHVAEFPDYLIALWSQLHLFKSFEDPIISGFNTSMFDNRMFEECLGHKPLHGFRTLDVMDVIYRHYPDLEQKKLSQLHEQFLKRPLVGAHGAIQDCLGTAAVLEYICEDVGKSPDQLSKELETEQVYSVMPIGKYRGYGVEDVPKSWANWMSNNATDMRPDLEATVEYVLNS